MDISANSVIVDDVVDESLKHKRKRSSQEQLKLNASSKKGIIKNMQHNANKNLLKVLLFGATGAVIYPLVPTLVQAITERDMSGWKGLIMGVGTASVLGLATGRPEITIGACSAAGTHLLYAKGTRVIEDLTNTQIFRMNPDSVIYNDNSIVGPVSNERVTTETNN